MQRWALILFCAAVSTWQYITLTLATCEDCPETIQRIVVGEIGAPFAYRLLTPQILVTLGNTVPVFAAFHFVALFLFFALLWRWCERWGGNGLAGVALATVALTLMYPTYYFSVYTVTEWVLWLAGLQIALMPRSRIATVAFAALVALGATNREMTAVLLLASWLALQPSRWRSLLGYGAVAGMAYGAVWLSVGPVENGYTISRVFELNQRGWGVRNLIVYGGLLLPLLLSAVCVRGHFMQLKRLTLIVLAVYLPLWATLAIWQETRLLMPVVILLLPLITRAKSASVAPLAADAGEQSLPSGHTASRQGRGERRLPASPEYAGADAGKGVGREVPEAL